MLIKDIAYFPDICPLHTRFAGIRLNYSPSLYTFVFKYVSSCLHSSLDPYTIYYDLNHYEFLSNPSHPSNLLILFINSETHSSCSIMFTITNQNERSRFWRFRGALPINHINSLSTSSSIKYQTYLSQIKVFD